VRPESALALAGLLLALGPAAGADPARDSAIPRITFAVHGHPVAALDLAALKRLTAPRDIRVFEPYEAREVGFRAFAFDAVLDGVYGADTWRAEEEILLSCRDGYQPAVPVRRFLEHRAWLAFQRIGAAEFALAKQEAGEQRRVSLGPFYLVWENLDDPRLRQEGDYGWPYQLVGVDLIRTRERFPRMLPPPGASASVRAGFEAFRIHCSRCHTLHGEGGRVGPELAGGDVVQRRGREWLRRWIDDPSQVMPNARMERLNPALPDRDRVIDEILDYLQAMTAPPPEHGAGD
jgi:mono/diheme cytochrome c family protein